MIVFLCCFLFFDFQWISFILIDCWNGHPYHTCPPFFKRISFHFFVLQKSTKLSQTPEPRPPLKNLFCQKSHRCRPLSPVSNHPSQCPVMTCQGQGHIVIDFGLMFRGEGRKKKRCLLINLIFPLQSQLTSGNLPIKVSFRNIKFQKWNPVDRKQCWVKYVRKS